MSRKSAYSDQRQAIVDEVIERVSNGETLRSICREAGKPSFHAVYAWLAEDPELERRFARARAMGFDAIAAETLEIADDARNDFMDRIGSEGQVIGRQLDSEHVQRSKLRIETRLKLLAKWDPKRYGEKLAIGGADDLPPIKTMSDDDLQKRIAALRAKVEGGGAGDEG